MIYAELPFGGWGFNAYDAEMSTCFGDKAGNYKNVR
jgi:hypothetical protein